MNITAKSRFLHGGLDLREGETADVSETVGAELIAAGLAFLTDGALKEKQAPDTENKMSGEIQNKSSGKK